jgi:hypothetical protein
MSERHPVCALSIIAIALVTGAWAQDTSSQPGDTPSPRQEPLPAYGQEDTPVTTSENPPLSGIDLPSLEPNTAPLSYLQPGATVSETADSNAALFFGHGSNFSSVSRALGSLTLRRLWSHYDLALDYVGGAAYYSLGGQGAKLLQQMDVAQKFSWRRGALTARDNFSYLPEGNFGGSYGSEGSAGIGSLGNTAFGAFFGGSTLGSFGLTPRITNVSLVDVTESLTPKSSVTAAGGYAFTHFYGKDATTGGSFFGVSQISAQVGYNRLLTARTQIALTYGYQAFDFSVSNMAFHSHVLQAMYGHRISGRMDFLIAAGPQLTYIDSQTAVCSDPAIDPGALCLLFGDTLLPVTQKTTRLSGAGQVHLRYKLPNTAFDLSYRRYLTSGSGLFAGAQSDIVRLGANRRLSRVWSAIADIGYTRNSRLQQLAAQQLATCVYPGQTNLTGLPICPGVNSNHYQYGFVGGGLHRQFGHDFHGFLSYQFNELAFDNSYCGGLGACSRISNRHVITFGLDWTPRPIRLD